MNISINKDNLLKSINIADSIISSKNINTILSNCLFNVTNDQIEIISTDNEVAVRTRIDSVSDSSGSFTINGKKLSDILKELPDDELILNISDSILVDIKSKSELIKGHYSLIGASADEFPKIPEFDEEESIEIEQAVLKEMIKKVIYAASSDTIKPVFNGLYIVSDSENSVTAVTTDSRRLSMIAKSIGKKIEIGDGIIIPLKAVNEIFRLLESTGNCRFSFKNNQCYFKIGNTEIVSRVVDGQFPNYKQVIPQEHNLQVKIETKKLFDSVKRAMIFTKEPAHKIVLNFNENTLIIEAKTPELGEAEEEINIESDSDLKISVGVNAQFLIDTLREIDTPNIRCGITGQMNPVKITPEDDDNYISVIMPIQIKSLQDD